MSRILEIDGELTRCRVKSDEPERQPYLVDLLPYWGNGKCDCKDFACRHEPHLARGDHTERLCKHLRAARVVFCRSVLHRMAELEGEQQ